MSPQKRPKQLSGFQLFYDNFLKEFNVKYPNSTIELSQVSTMCCENWQKLSRETRKRFQDEAETVNIANSRPPSKPQRQVLTKVQNWISENFCPQDHQPKKSKKKKNTHVLKMKQPFIYFAREVRPFLRSKYPEMTYGQISRVLSKMWRNADDGTKMMYKQKSLNQRGSYRKEK